MMAIQHSMSPENNEKSRRSDFIRGIGINHWPEILVGLGIDPRFLVRRHGPCPACGGKDRFRFDDREGRGTFYCNQCGAGDGIRLLQNVFGWTFLEASKAVSNYLIGRQKPDTHIGPVFAAKGRPSWERLVNRLVIQDRDLLPLLPKKPYCSNDLNFGMVVRPRSKAVTFKYLQINDLFVKVLIFDIDRPFGAWAWEAAGLPVPAWAMVNPKNGYAHLVYPLKTPVCRTDAGHLKPLKYLAVIEAGYRNRLEADPGYSGLLTKNPLHPDWCSVNFDGSAAYDLAYLADWIDLPKKSEKRILPEGLGRNCALFDVVREWAYRAIKNYWIPEGSGTWHKAVLDYCWNCNVFPVPLPDSEIRATAKSIANWTLKRITPQGREGLIQRTHTPKIQAFRGKKGGGRSGEIRKMKSDIEFEQALSKARIYWKSQKSGSP